MKGNLKRVLSLLLVMLMFFTAVPVESIAASTEMIEEFITDGNILYGETVDSGTCGTGVNWTFYEDGTLRISGEGEMSDFIFTGELYEGIQAYINHYEDYDGEDMSPYMTSPENLSESDSAELQSFMLSVKKL